jgi:hypothetical protein
VFGIIAAVAGKALKANLGGIKRAVGLAPKKTAPAPALADQVRDTVERAREQVRAVTDRVAGGAVDAATQRATSNFWGAPKTKTVLGIAGGAVALLLLILGVVAFRRRS